MEDVSMWHDSQSRRNIFKPTARNETDRIYVGDVKAMEANLQPKAYKIS